MTLRERQLERLRALVARIVPGNAFYTKRLREAGLAGGVPSLEAFSEKMPLTLKPELVEDQERNPPYGSNLTYPLAEYTRFNQTSGTSGKPLVWLDTPEGWQWMLDNWKEVYRNAGVKKGDKVYFAFSFGPFLGFWTAYGAAAQYGCLSIPGGGLSSAARLAAILKHQADYLCCTPTYALRLAEVASEQGVDLSGCALRRIIVAGEPGGNIPAVRQRVREAWGGVELYDHHGMTEIGPVSYEDPAHPGNLRVVETSYYCEVVDPETAEPAAAGEVGELVLTTLGRDCSPLLRYRTGDLVKPRYAEEEDGARIVLEGGIIGRADDMAVVRGVNIYPSAVDAVVRGCRDVAEYEVELSTRGAMAEIAIKAEAVPEVSVDAVRAHLQDELRNAFSLRIPVTMVAAGTLPRYEMKARRWKKDRI